MNETKQYNQSPVETCAKSSDRGVKRSIGTNTKSVISGGNQGIEWPVKTGVPIPPRRYSRIKAEREQLASLKPGEAMELGNNTDRQRLYMAATRRQLKVTTRKMNGYYMLWRIP